MTEDKREAAQQAWNDLLAIMRTTPIELPPEWAEEVKVSWGSQDNVLILSVPMGTDAQWLERMFLPVAKVFFRQLQDGGELVVEYEKGAVDEDLRLKAERGAYEQIVKPEKVIPVSLYMFQHWLPALEPNAFWVVIAMRQMAFVSRADSAQVGKRISLRDLARWVPMHYSTVRRSLRQDHFLPWFFTESKEAHEDLPPEYTVYVDYPLAPHHLAWIESYLQKGLGEGRSLEWTLKELLDRTQEVRSVKHGDVSYNPDYGNERHSLLDLVARYQSPEVDKLTHDLIQQLQREITRDYLTVSIPHYFLKRYGDELSANEAALIWYLRSLYSDDAEGRHHFQGYTSLADRVGFGRKTLKRMFARCTAEASQEEQGNPLRAPVYNPELTLGNWLQVAYHSPSVNGQGREFSIAVRNSEPIHPRDEDKYLQLVEKEIDALIGQTETPPGQIETGEWEAVGQSETPPLQTETGIPQPPRQPETASGQDETPPGQPETEHERSETGRGRFETDPGQGEPAPAQDETPGVDKAQHLNKLPAKDVNQFIPQDTPQDSFQPQPLDDISEPTPAVGGGEVDMDKLLGFAGYSRQEKTDIFPIVAENEPQFLAWLIRNHLTRADFPIRLAVKNIQENNIPESRYLGLARLGWGKVAELLLSDYVWLDDRAGDIEKTQELIKDLRETSLLGMLRDVLLAEVAPKERGGIPSPREEENAERVPVYDVPEKYRQAWIQTRGELQREIPKGNFDTWVKDIELAAVIDQDTFVFVAQNPYTRDWLDQRLKKKMEKMLTPQVFAEAEQTVKVKFVSAEEMKDAIGR